MTVEKTMKSDGTKITTTVFTSSESSPGRICESEFHHDRTDTIPKFCTYIVYICIVVYSLTYNRPYICIYRINLYRKRSFMKF